MLLFCQLFIALITCAITVNKSQTYCIWGRAGALTNTFINGEWVYASTDSYGNPYYIKPICEGSSLGDTDYLYYDSPYWKIGSSLFGGANARCVASSNLTKPSCSEAWEVWGGGVWTTDNNVAISLGTCPEWDCDSIIVSGSSNSYRCDGTFYAISGVRNAFQKTTSNPDHYIYFMDGKQDWYCNDLLENNVCSASWYNRGANLGWQDIIPFQSYDPGNTLGQMQCIRPTNSPSQHPTSEPTLEPTIFPSDASPTQEPTWQPSSAPSTRNTTSVPSESPSTYPSRSPIQTTSGPSSTPSTAPYENSNSMMILPSEIPSTSDVPITSILQLDEAASMSLTLSEVVIIATAASLLTIGIISFILCIRL